MFQVFMRAGLFLDFLYLEGEALPLGKAQLSVGYYLSEFLHWAGSELGFLLPLPVLAVKSTA